ncbi:T9SS type A sorting domain-containing protein [Spirosoma sp. SC4-14]|uniref:T9SS type A sorting domain-containing protein n=1 Tax=Spirosoma sp. SC4-14 TaxID=3128900 RepID=UPI0030CCCC43
MDIALPVRLHQWILCSFLCLLCSLSALTGMAQSPLNLPFFDDFSTASGRPGIDQPDTTRWLPGSGVYINNTMAINQPTVNVASFDGLAANGLPYVFNNGLSRGYTDTLTSKSINLAGLTAADSVYLSFYWQIKGLGEAPDAASLSYVYDKQIVGNDTTTVIDTIVLQPGDSLVVEFLDVNKVWQHAWGIAGGETNNNFPQAFVLVKDPNYFHPNFAFRFRSFARQSGPFDTWNIDYIYLGKNRSVTNRYIKDVAVRQAVSPFLKRYTAMPLTQYMVNPAAETADSVFTDINNLFNTFNFTTFRFTVQDEVSGQLLQDSPQTASSLIQALSSQIKVSKPNPISSFGSATKAMLRYKFEVLTTDDQNPSIPGVNLRQNDTISGVTVLDNYYAYDDGTWEYGAQIGPREQVAMRFILNKPDVMAGIQACIVPFVLNQTGQSFVISVYSNSNGRPGNAIYRQEFMMQYPPTRNGFVSFPFSQGVAVKDTFYVGYQQISSSDTTILRLGIDKNSPFSREIFYNGGTIWEQNLSGASLSFQGVFMLRPVMGGKDDGIVTGVENPEPVSPLQAYPNPTTGLIRWDNTKLTRLDVLNLTGQILHQLEPSRGQQTLDLSDLPNGMYLIRLFEGERLVVQKLIIQH